MTLSRRSFLSLASASALSAGSTDFSTRIWGRSRERNQGHHELTGPWIEVLPEALRFNVQQIAKLASDRPILAVVKNNAYGLGLSQVAPVLEQFPEIYGFAVVRTEAALALRAIGIRKPILLMGLTPENDIRDLVAHQIDLSLYTPEALQRIKDKVRPASERIRAHYYIDTGMGRMGMPYHEAVAWIKEIQNSESFDILGTYMAFTEDAEFDIDQLRRFSNLSEQCNSLGLDLGVMHAASSNGVYHLPNAHLDMVRPGISLYGSYPSRPKEEREIGMLKTAFRLQAPVVRLARLRPGDSVSYGRNYVAEYATWIATLPVGHADGYPREAVKGSQVLINDTLYPVIGAVSASHTIVEVGPEATVALGDTATLIGPEHEAIHPNAIASTLSISVYDVLMHLSPSMPRALVE